MATPNAPEYIAWRARRDQLAASLAAASARWNAIPGTGSGALGLTPDSVKQTPEWQACYDEYWHAHKALASHNAAGVRRWRRELGQERAALRAGLLAGLP